MHQISQNESHHKRIKSESKTNQNEIEKKMSHQKAINAEL